MDIARERFLDGSRAFHMTLTLRSRTTDMHSVLTALDPAERERVSEAIVRALNEIEAIVRVRLPEPATPA